MDVEAQFEKAKTDRNFINEHIETLYDYAKQCEHVTECGVESCISSWAFLRGLRDSSFQTKLLRSIDVNYHPNIPLVRKACEENGVDFHFLQGSDLDVQVEPTDLCFIDTWHVYGHLKRELARFAPITKKYIIMHDTEVDGLWGETLRRHWNAEEQALQSGYPLDEIRRGLRPAVDEFLETHKDLWRVLEHRTNCNGLTVLERIGEEPTH